MAESVDALVSNTSGATHPGSIPGLGTETEKVEKLSPFSFFSISMIIFAKICISDDYRDFILLFVHPALFGVNERNPRGRS